MFLISFFVFFSFCASKPMMPLFGPERRNYLAELKAKKVAEGYDVSDPSGVLLRKVKRKDAPSKTNAIVWSSKMEIDRVEKVGDGAVVEPADTSKRKKG